MLQGTQYKTLFVLPTKSSLKATIDLLKQNVTKVKNSQDVTSGMIVFGNNKLYPKFSIEQRAIELFMKDPNSSKKIK